MKFFDLSVEQDKGVGCVLNRYPDILDRYPEHVRAKGQEDGLGTVEGKQLEENRDVVLQLTELQGEMVRLRSNSNAQKIREITVTETW